MSQSDTPNYLNRRNFLGNSVAAGLAGLALVETVGASPGSSRFKNLTPLKPAPIFVLGPVEPPPLGALVYNKAAYGPRPGDVEAFNALPGISPEEKLSAWLDEQLNPHPDLDQDPDIHARLMVLESSGNAEDMAAYDTIDKTPEELWVDHARSDDYSTRMRPVWQMERLTLLRAAYSKWQLREVLYDFWFNHFNVYGREFPTYGMMPQYDRVLREHIFGNFGDMLRANARTASMLYYLDNYANTWPNPNENYAREVLELHTLGAVKNYYGAVDPASLDAVHGLNEKGQRRGYTEIDVFELAKALTGWGVLDGSNDGADTGAFVFRSNKHYNATPEAPIHVMDVQLTATSGEADVTDILDYLAGHFGTAQYIAWKLCTRLIGDNPDQGLIDSTAEVFWSQQNAPDQLQQVYRHVIESAAFANTWGNKVARPVETVVRAWRATGVDLTIRIDHNDSNSIWGRLDDTSHYPFGYSPPTGYPDERAFWQGSGPLIMSWRTVTYMLRIDRIVNQAAQTNAHFTNPDDRTANNIVYWWINRALGHDLPAAVSDRIIQYVTDILASINASFPGDYANEPLKTFMDTDTLFNMDGTAKNNTYQRIIRGLIGLILMTPQAMRR